MIAKQIEAPGYEVSYDNQGRIFEARTTIRGVCAAPIQIRVYKSGVVSINSQSINVQGVQELEAFLAATRHLRPGAEEANADPQVSPNNSKNLEEAITLFRDAWGYVPIRLRAAIAKVLEESIENGEAFIKSAREYELTEGIDNG